ncbi:MAG: hypothetical protein WCK15_12310, partial [Pirellula sp.]
KGDSPGSRRMSSNWKTGAFARLLIDMKKQLRMWLAARARSGVSFQLAMNHGLASWTCTPLSGAIER